MTDKPAAIGPLSFVLAAGSIALLACSGDIMTTPSPDENGRAPLENPLDEPEFEAPGAGPSFSCSADVAPPNPPMRRLSRRQLENTIADLLRFSLGGAKADQTFTGLGDGLKAIPPDAAPAGEGFVRGDQLVVDGHIDALYELAKGIGKALSATDQIASTVGACATDGRSDNDEACLRDFIKHFGSRALRAPLADEDISFYQRLAREPGGSVAPVNVENVIAGLLMAPGFLYHVESAARAINNREDLSELSAPELAARLSYHFWDTMPDEALWAAALDGSLLEPEVFRAELDRLIADPRVQGTIENFYRQWLHLDNLPQLDMFKNDARWKAFAGDQPPGPDLHRAMSQEIVDLANHFTWTTSGQVHDLLRTDLSFARSGELARHYGIAPWEEGTEPPAFPAGERPGILTRGAGLVTASGNTRPIMRGVFVRHAILCDELPTPPPGALDNLPMPDPKLSGRQAVVEITERAAACAGCHQSLINPIGFMLEGYDALGRRRHEEVVRDQKGEVLAVHPVNDEAVPQIEEGDERPARRANELTLRIEESGKFPACMARQYLRFAMSRHEDDKLDSCMLERMRRAFATGGLQAGLRAVATDPAFWRRSF